MTDTETTSTTYYAAYSNHGGKRVHASTALGSSSLDKIVAVCGAEVHTTRKGMHFDTPDLTSPRCRSCAQVTGFETEPAEGPPAGLRIWRLFGQLPHCGGTLPHYDDLDMEDVADKLDALVKWFESSRDHQAERDSELFRHRSAVQGLRSFLSLLKEGDEL